MCCKGWVCDLIETAENEGVREGCVNYICEGYVI